MAKKQTKEAISFLNEIIEKGLDLKEFTKALINYLRQTLLLKIGESESLLSGLTKEEIVKLKELSGLFEEKKLHHSLELFLEAENKMKFSPIQQLPLELAIIELGEQE